MPSGRANWPFNYRPIPGGFGDQFAFLAAALATAGPALVGTATTSIYIGGVPGTKQTYVAAASMEGGAPFTGASTVTAQLIKKRGSTDTALTAAYDLTAALSAAGYADVPITADNVGATVEPGDTLRWDVVAAGTLGGGDLRGGVELAIGRTT